MYNVLLNSCLALLLLVYVIVVLSVLVDFFLPSFLPSVCLKPHPHTHRYNKRTQNCVVPSAGYNVLLQRVSLLGDGVHLCKVGSLNPKYPKP